MRVTPKRNPRASVATGGLFLMFFAALSLALAGRRPAVAVPPQAAAETPRPPARLVSGASAQGDFTLLAVTRGGPWPSRPAVPPTVPAPPGSVPPFQIVMATEDATGLWIGVRGGIGFQTIPVPKDGRRHVYPFGPAALVVDEADPRGTAFGWNGPDGVSRVAEGVSPYGFQGSWAAASPGHPAGPVVTLIPCRLADHFSVTAQPLDGAGRALGRPVSLLCQSVSPQVMFAQFPNGYSARTRQFRVTAARVGTKNAGASWRLGALPPAVQNGPNLLPPAVVAGFGPLTIRAAAAEAEDFSGYPDWWNRHPPRRAGGGWTDGTPQAVDMHRWTGVPSLRLLLSYHNFSPDYQSQLWTVEITRVAPQWGPSAAPQSTYAVTYHGNGDPTTAWPIVTEDWQVGAAYPGQQHWVQVDGTAFRSATRTETLTFHDADVVHDAAFGGDRIVWEHPETETTPSGVTVSVLNGRPGVSDQGAGVPGASLARFDLGNAEMLLAWHLPPGLLSVEHASLTEPRAAYPPWAVGTLSSQREWSQPLLWDALAAPGASEAGALRQAGYEPLLFSVRSTVAAPFDFSRLPRHEGLFQLPPALLPRHLKTITFRIDLREEQERHPFHLVVPIQATFPPGWDPDVAGGRYRRP